MLTDMIAKTVDSKNRVASASLYTVAECVSFPICCACEVRVRHAFSTAVDLGVVIHEWRVLLVLIS